jgi:hypothetical protein
MPATATRLERLRDALSRPVAPDSLVAFRIAFGLLMLWDVYRYLSKGWVEGYYVGKEFLFTYPGFGWVRPWPGDLMVVHFYALGYLAILIAAGAAYRLATSLFFVGFTYVFLLERAHYLNHFYLIALVSLLMVVVPAHRAFSVDALLRPRLRAGAVPAWAVWLLRFQIAIPYTYGGIAKLDGDWLRGEPMRSWMAYVTDFPLVGRWFVEDWMVYAVSWSGLALDLLVVPGLLWRRTRPWAFAAAVLFHLMNSRLFTIGVFPWFMIAATTIFFEPDWPRRLVGLLRRSDAPAATSSPAPPFRIGRLGLGGLAVWCAIQLLVPLRHLLYPGAASWTEEGHAFAWHMKLRDKEGDVTFVAVDKTTGRREPLDGTQILSWRQYQKMSTRPYMIQQFARHLAEAERRRGRDDVEIRVESYAALNGREYQELIDPTVDLAAEPVSLLPARWIVPLDTPLRRGGGDRAAAFEASD